MDPFIGEIKMVPYTFAPRGWALCNGQLLPINQNQALFSLLGTTYGGDGRTTFALPDLRGRVAIHPGNGPGLSPYALGQKGGSESVILTSNQMPSHSHNLMASNNAASTGTPTGKYIANTGRTSNYGDLPADKSETAMASGAIALAGGNQPVSIIQPYLTANFIIALEGIYPSRD